LYGVCNSIFDFLMCAIDCQAGSPLSSRDYTLSHLFSLPPDPPDLTLLSRPRSSNAYSPYATPCSNDFTKLASPRLHFAPPGSFHSPSFLPPRTISNCVRPSCLPCQGCLCRAKDSHSGCGMRGNMPILTMTMVGKSSAMDIMGLRSLADCSSETAPAL
jgi:hypothetical protein